jgi:hypothetical protein
LDNQLIKIPTGECDEMNATNDMGDRIFVATDQYLLVDLCRLISKYVGSLLCIIGGEYTDRNIKDTYTRELSLTEVWDGYRLQSFAENQHFMQWPYLFIDPNGRLGAGGRGNAHTEVYNSSSNTWEVLEEDSWITAGRISRPPRLPNEKYHVYLFQEIGILNMYIASATYDATRDGFWILNSNMAVWFYDVQRKLVNKSFPLLLGKSTVGTWSQFAIVHGKVYVVGSDTSAGSNVAHLLSNSADDWIHLDIPLRVNNNNNNNNNNNGFDGLDHLLDMSQTCASVAAFGDEILFIGGMFYFEKVDQKVAQPMQKLLQEKAITSWNPSSNERKLVTILPRPRTYFSTIVI